MEISSIKNHLKSADSKLASIIHDDELSWPIYSGPFESLSKAIVGQQLSVKAADTIYKRFSELLELRLTPESLDKVTDEELRGIGLSHQKTSYMRDLARYFSDPAKNDPSLWSGSDEEIIKELTSIKGLGVWTVQMFLMFDLRRLDILPLDDLGIKMGMCNLYGLAPKERGVKKKLELVAEPWRPYRSIACRYIWHYQNNS